MPFVLEKRQKKNLITLADGEIKMTREFWENFIDETENEKGTKQWLQEMAIGYIQGILWGVSLLFMIALIGFVSGSI